MTARHLPLFEESEPIELLPYDGSALFRPWVLGARSADALMKKLLDEVDWEQRSIVLFGREVRQPRLNSWYGDVAYTYSGITMTPRAWLPLLVELREICEEHARTSFNSVLVNLYRDGADSMGWHADDEPELGSSPVIASLSIGATRRFRFRHRTTRDVVQRDLPSGSLVVMSGLSQSCWMHEIPKQKSVVDSRINLTFRTVHG